MRQIIFIFMFVNLWGIDVIIPSVEKDLEILDTCIDSVKAHVSDVDRIIVVSKRRLTNKAEWLSEDLFPFSLEDVAFELGIEGHSRVGWYFQQLLKFYAPLVTEDISNDVLILDSDTVILHPVQFILPNGQVRFSIAPNRYIYQSYYDHMARLHPILGGVRWNFSPILHHMLFQRNKLEVLFHLVETYHQKPFWQAFLDCVEIPDRDMIKLISQSRNKLIFGASEYAIYFAFMQKLYPQFMFISAPRIENGLRSLDDLDKAVQCGFDLASCHSWRRGI